MSYVVVRYHSHSMMDAMFKKHTDVLIFLDHFGQVCILVYVLYKRSPRSSSNIHYDSV